MPGMKFWAYPHYGEVHPCGISKMQLKIMFPILPWLCFSQVYQLSHFSGSCGTFPAGKLWVWP